MVMQLWRKDRFQKDALCGQAVGARHCRERGPSPAAPLPTKNTRRTRGSALGWLATMAA